jgi:hypothetical protein
MSGLFVLGLNVREMSVSSQWKRKSSDAAGRMAKIRHVRTSVRLQTQGSDNFSGNVLRDCLPLGYILEHFSSCMQLSHFSGITARVSKEVPVF